MSTRQTCIEISLFPRNFTVDIHSYANNTGIEEKNTERTKTCTRANVSERINFSSFQFLFQFAEHVCETLERGYYSSLKATSLPDGARRVRSTKQKEMQPGDGEVDGARRVVKRGGRATMT